MDEHGPEPPPRPATAPRHVLVVDDNADAAESLAVVLPSIAGYEVVGLLSARFIDAVIVIG